MVERRQAWSMPSSYRRRDLAATRADRTLQQLGYEARIAREAAGLSLRTMEEATGTSRSQLSRIERGNAPLVSIRTLVTIFTVLGLRLSAKPYPDGPPVRDHAHARLLARFRARLATSIRMRLEVPLGLKGDLRAWDAELATPDGDTCKLEAETVIADLQAADRRIARKLRDAGADRVILLVADTKGNRRVMRDFGDLLAERYPLRTRAILCRLRTGKLPEASGICML